MCRLLTKFVALPRSLFTLLIVGLVVARAYGQGYNEVLVHMPEMVQYQKQKARASEQGRLSELQVQPFKKMGFKRIHAKAALDADDPRHVWGYHVHANREFDKDNQALYRLFKKGDWGSMVVIDYFAANDNKCELVFWGKKYYRRFATELRRMGFGIKNSSTQTNVLEFRKPDTTIGIDVVVWPEIYIMQFKEVK